jgi:hypothetical protein
MAAVDQVGQVVAGWWYFSATIVTTVGVITSAYFARSSKKNVGKKNGQGTVVEMLERSLLESAKLHEKIDNLDQTTKIHSLAIAKLADEVHKPTPVNVLPVIVPPAKEH